jgi:hypothetical protein
MATKKTKTLTEVVEKLPVKRKAKVEKRAAELIDPSGVVRGSHLTVITFSDGTTKLDWDDEALLRDVRAAILKAESAIPVSEETKPKRKKKVAE